MRRASRGGSHFLYQKVVSGLLIFSILFSITFRIPLDFFAGKAQAAGAEYYNLVSIIVQEDIYSGVKSALNAYAKNVQKTLEKTKVVVIPAPSTARAFDIASLLENLYFKGYKSVSNVNFESKLVGTVFVGNIPLPFASDNNNFSKTILPYVDFADKAYVYNHKTKNYERDTQVSKIEADIWHGFISPNTGDSSQDIQKINDYFEKNADFYNGTGNFSQDKGVLSGDVSTGIPEKYEPYVFYYDQFRENTAVDTVKYKGYQAYLDNIEDLTYHRYSKDLAERVKGYILGEQDSELKDLITKLDPKFDTSKIAGPSTQGVGDITTRYITNNTVKNFLEIFNDASIGEFRKFVNNSGRYSGDSSAVNVDLPPFLISVLDLVSAQIIKNANTELENEIDAVVKKGLSRDIAIPTSINNVGGGSGVCGSSYINFLHGKDANTITNAKECTIYRGSLTNSGTLVESNRAFNVNNMQADYNLCAKDAHKKDNPDKIGEILSQGYWGGNSPINLVGNEIAKGNFVQGPRYLSLSVTPLYDPAGSKAIEDESKTPNPKMCLNNSLLLASQETLTSFGMGHGETGYRCDLTYRIPSAGGRAGGWSCRASNQKLDFPQTFEQFYQSFNGAPQCTVRELKLGSTTLKSFSNVDPYNSETGFGCMGVSNQTYNFKKITSYIEHKAPLIDDLKAQIQTSVTPSLPIDKNRYIDFIGANGTYQKINYPYLFRVTTLKKNPTIKDYDEALKGALDYVSDRVSKVIKDANPGTLSGLDKTFYDLLKTGDFPADTFDLYAFLKNKPTKLFTLSGETKKMSYLDTLSFALYWKSLTSPTAKYKFIFENYLNDELSVSGDNLDFHLPKNKKQYEVAYLGAPGDAQSMYVKMDPDGKAANPYGDVISSNVNLNGYLFSSNITSTTPKDSNEMFKCAPPDGVPIWQWIPAVICRLKDMLPPKIKISDGVCSASLLSEAEVEELEECSYDANKNGINDCIEARLKDGEILLTSDASRYFYDSPGDLRASLLDSSGNLISFDNITDVNFRLRKVEVPKDADKIFDDTNVKEVYNFQTETEATRNLIANYINFTQANIRANGGEAELLFSTRGKDANLIFDSFIDVKDNKGHTVISLLSHPVKIQVRGDRLFAASSLIDNNDGTPDLQVAQDTVKVSEYTNVYITDENKQNLQVLYKNINNNSLAKEKLVFSLSNFTKGGVKLDVAYPVHTSLYYEDEEHPEKELVLTSGDTTNFKGLFDIKKSGRYHITFADADGFVYEKEFFVSPDVAIKGTAQLGSTVAESKGSITTNIITLFDRFDNPASGNLYDISGTISGGALEFYENSKDTIELQTYEGYRAFQLRTNNKTGDNSLKFDVKQNSTTLFTISSQMKVVDKIVYNIVPVQSKIVVGGGRYDFKVTFKDSTGNTLTGLNSRVYLSLDQALGAPTKSYFDVHNGEALVSFNTKTVAKKSATLSFQLEGAKTIEKYNVGILPEKPIRLDYSLSRAKMEASETETSALKVEMKDRYNNVVFTDSTTQIALEILDRYKTVVSSDTELATVKEGVASFTLKATPTPGVAYFKVSALPNFDANSFTIEGQTPFAKTSLTIAGMKSGGDLTGLGKKFFEETSTTTYRFKFGTKNALLASPDYSVLGAGLKEQILNFWLANNGIVVKPVSVNAGKVETFYFWNKSKLEGKRYNALYTTLLGAPYGDITQKDYLAGSLLFNKNNRSLSVTSLLNNPGKYNDILSLQENGLVDTTYSKSDLSQNIEYLPYIDDVGRVKMSIRNTSLNTLIGDITYSFDTSSTYLDTCDDFESDISECTPSSEKTSIFLKSLDTNYTAAYVGTRLVLNSSKSDEVFSISKDGRVEKNVNIYLLYDQDSTKFPQFSIMTGEKKIGVLAFNYVDGKVIKTKDPNVLANSLNALKNSIGVYVSSSLYQYRDISDGQHTTHYISYQDPFSNDFSLDTFTQNSLSGYENFYGEGGLGWQGQNKILLLLASGKSVGEATRAYQSFGLINLGDPVVMLKKIQKKLPGSDTDLRSFEQGVGDLISKDTNTVAVKTFDYNKDGRKDVVTLSNDGYFTLLENKKAHEPFKNLGHLAYIVDMKGRSVVETGNFTGDGYDDIFFVNKDGDPFLLNNVTKDFIRIPLKDQFKLEGKIMQVRSFDMDNDGKTDLVTLDDAGQIHIFYGGGTSTAPQFTKKLVGNGYGIELNSTPRSEGGIVYYDTLYQLPKPGDTSKLLADNDAYLKKIQDNADDAYSEDELLYNASFMDHIFFEQITYDPNDDGKKNIEFAKNDEPELEESLNDAEQELAGFLDEYGEYTNTDDYYDYGTYTTFVRSEYALGAGVDVKKVYTDLNGGTLKTGDKVKVEVTITNASSKKMLNMAYMESIPSPFIINNDVKITAPTGVVISRAPTSGYEFMANNFDLATGAQIKITYEVQTLPIKFGYILAGLFEKGEVGDDVYGDVIVKPNNKNCGEDIDIYRSVAVRSYEKGKTKAECKDQPADPKTKDDNKNGIPDYIEDLIGGSNDDALNYAKEELEKLRQDSDGDGIPNNEDDTPYFNDDTGLLNFESGMGDKIEEISKQMDFFLKGFSCGFGGGACIASPLNWAPLAPGNDPTLMGYPIGDGLHVGEGYPIFAFPTVPACPFCPPMWPISPYGAGGRLDGTPTGLGISQFRLFVTPTLTGGAGTAVCFGPNTGAWAFAPGISPILPGGQCVVAAMPLFGCKDDGSDGDIVSKGPPVTGEFGIINGNCSDGENTNPLKKETDGTVFDKTLIQDFITYKKTGTYPANFKDRLKKALSTVSTGRRYTGGTLFPRDALINMEGGGANDMSLSVDINPRELVNGNFGDVVKVQMKRVWPFPGFLMEWVTRQVEEIVTKLTDFPTLFIILPDFSGLMDDRWSNFTQNVKNSWEKGQQNFEKAQTRANNMVATLRSQRPSDCSGANALKCSDIDSKIAKLQMGDVPSDVRNLFNQGRGGMSGVSEVYKFLSNLPLVAIQPQVVSISVPWIDSASINRTLISWRGTLNQWQNEVGKYAAPLDCARKEFGGSKAACDEANSLRNKIYLDAHKLLSSLEKNIQAIEDYKNFPKKLANLLGKKEERLAQILCNIESITYLVGGWIGKNGKRFQAWVELYVLIKAVLKSWQVLIDIFTDYTASCHQCKNERHDLLNFVFKLINMIIPKIPVIQFPKWPDIVLDLHNIRAGLVIYMPDFKFSKRPIILPNLPALILPDIPNIKIQLPALPILPTIKLPELPDLPSLPRVTLPDLPPPPKLPKMFASLEVIANIMKLIAKAMCILKGSPFVPEWRAGDQIAFMTERSGYLSFDFLDLALPQFSYPFVDAIKVTTYVNLEFENEFVVEMVRNILKPLNSFTNNFANSLNYAIPTLDFSEMTPADINVKVQPDVKDPVKVGKAPTREEFNKIGNEFTQHTAKVLSNGILELAEALKTHKDEEVENAEFVEIVSKSLASKSFTRDPRFEPIQKIWKDALNYDFSAEKALVEELQKNNTEKFQTLHDIITTEIQETKNLKKSVDTLQESSSVENVSVETNKRIEAYKQKLEPFNERFIQAANTLIQAPMQNEKEIAQTGKNILAQVDRGVTSFAKEIDDQGAIPEKTISAPSSKIVQKAPVNTPILPTTVGHTQTPLMSYTQANKQLAAGGGGSSGGVCTTGGKNYVYKGLYVVEKGISYRLFHYLDEITGNEETINLDYDLDGDDDILYTMAGQVFVKENLKKKDATKIFVTDAPLYLAPSTNKYFNGDIYYESINGFREGNVNDSFINVLFSAPKRDDVSNFRLEFYQIVDKFTNLLSDTYEPENLKKYVIDAIAGKEDATFVKDEENYSVYKNLAYIENIGNLAGITMLTKEVKNIADDIDASSAPINITSGTPVYAGSTKFTLEYRENEGDEIQSVTVDRYQNIRFKNTVKVSRLLGNAYVVTDKDLVVKGNDIDKFAYLPIALGTKIYVSDEARSYDALSHLEIHYYDDSRLKVDWRDIKSYYLFDLGRKTDTYLIRQELQNDFYYAVIQMFQNGIIGNLSKQILLSPQKEADTKKPDITLDNAIRIPVYQKKLFDFTEYIYEETGVKNIEDFYIDFDIEKDADGDGDATNDRTTENILVKKSLLQIAVEFGPYDAIFTRNIGINAIDRNGNRGYKAVPFEVYPPIPSITGNVNSKVSGYIDETLKEEPVNIYRLRGGVLTKLLDASGKQKVPTGSGGTYNFTAKTATGVVLTYNDSTMGKIDEFTGKITLQNPAVSIKVFPSGTPNNDKGFPKIALLLNGEEVYFEYLTFAKEKEVQVVEEFDGLKDAGMYLRFTGEEGGYNTYKIPLTAPINPGATVVYDIKKGRNTPLFTILRDGRIYTAGSVTYKLEYANYGDNVMFRLVDNDAGKEIATLLMKVDGNYIIQ